MLIFQLSRPTTDSVRRHGMGLPTVTQEELEDFRNALMHPESPIVLANLQVDVWPVFKNEEVDAIVKECADAVFSPQLDSDSPFDGTYSELKDFALRFVEKYLKTKPAVEVIAQSDEYTGDEITADYHRESSPGYKCDSCEKEFQHKVENNPPLTVVCAIAVSVLGEFLRLWRTKRMKASVEVKGVLFGVLEIGECFVRDGRQVVFMKFGGKELNASGEKIFSSADKSLAVPIAVFDEGSEPDVLGVATWVSNSECVRKAVLSEPISFNYV